MATQKRRFDGRNKLRSLREQRQSVQFALELDGIITQANYSKIERGLATPSREKLVAILDAFKASFNERRDILLSYGYRVPYPLPGVEETEAIRTQCQPVLDSLPIPAYLVDIITRLVSWNRLFEPLAGGGDRLKALVGRALFKAKFVSRLQLQEFMGKLDEVLLESVQEIYVRLVPYQDERWYGAFVEELCEEKGFRHYWDAVAAMGPRNASPVTFATQILHPVQFSLPDLEGATLEFYSNSERLQTDDRFQMLYLVPANAYTLRQVERWRSAELSEIEA